jgi:hypothetical protein
VSSSAPTSNGSINFSVALWFPAGQDDIDGKHFKLPDWGPLRITWTITVPSVWDDESACRSTDHFSMLPIGDLPEDGLEFFAQFLEHFKKVWIAVGNLAEQHLIDCVCERPTLSLVVLSHDHCNVGKRYLTICTASQPASGKGSKSGTHIPTCAERTNMDQSSPNSKRSNQHCDQIRCELLLSIQRRSGP